MKPFNYVVSGKNWESTTSTMGDFLLVLPEDDVPPKGTKCVDGIANVSPWLYEST